MGGLNNGGTWANYVVKTPTNDDGNDFNNVEMQPYHAAATGMNNDDPSTPIMEDHAINDQNGGYSRETFNGEELADDDDDDNGPKHTVLPESDDDDLNDNQLPNEWELHYT